MADSRHKRSVTLHWQQKGHVGVSNHQPHGYLLSRLFRRRSKKTSKLRVTGLCMWNSPGPVNSPHKGPVTRKMFPFDDVIMNTELDIRSVVLFLENYSFILNGFTWSDIKLGMSSLKFSFISIIANDFCFTEIILCCRIWSWSPMLCEKHGPRDSVDKNRGRRPRFLS